MREAAQPRVRLLSLLAGGQHLRILSLWHDGERVGVRRVEKESNRIEGSHRQTRQVGCHRPLEQAVQRVRLGRLPRAQQRLQLGGGLRARGGHGATRQAGRGGEERLFFTRQATTRAAGAPCT